MKFFSCLFRARTSTQKFIYKESEPLGGAADKESVEKKEKYPYDVERMCWELRRNVLDNAEVSVFGNAEGRYGNSSYKFEPGPSGGSIFTIRGTIAREKGNNFYLSYKLKLTEFDDKVSVEIELDMMDEPSFGKMGTWKMVEKVRLLRMKNREDVFVYDNDLKEGGVPFKELSPYDKRHFEKDIVEKALNRFTNEIHTIKLSQLKKEVNGEENDEKAT